MIKKRILCVLLSGIALFATSCQTTLDPEKTEDGSRKMTIEEAISTSQLQYPAANDVFYYEVYDNYVAITKYLGDETYIKDGEEYTVLKDVVIPDMIDGLPVCIIGANAFSGSSIKTIKITKNIAFISDYAFSNCVNLTAVTFSDVKEESKTIESGKGPTTLGKAAFSGCKELQNITLPESLETLGKDSFADCTNLRKINIPSLIVEIPSNFCSNCASLEKIYISDTVTTISDNAFSGVSEKAKIYGSVYSSAAQYAAKYFISFSVSDTE